MTRVLTKHQVKAGPERGSWNPDGVWGEVGGRVYSTAMATLSLESYYHYTRLGR